MDTNTLLYIAFILYLIIMIVGYVFNVRFLFMIAGLLWFIPIFEIDNTFIVIISASMILFHAILGFGSGKRDDFE